MEVTSCEEVFENLDWGSPIESHIVLDLDFVGERGLVESAMLGVVKAELLVPWPSLVFLIVEIHERHGGWW